MREHRILRAGWMAASFESGYRLVDPSGRVYQVLRERISTGPARGLQGLVESGEGFFDTNPSEDCYHLIASCTLPLDPALGGRSDAAQAGAVYFVAPDPEPAIVASTPVEVLDAVVELPLASLQTAVVVAHVDDVLDSGSDSIIDDWLSHPLRYVIPINSEGDVASIGPVLSPLRGTGCPQCLRERLAAAAQSKFGLSADAIDDWVRVPGRPYGTAVTLATACGLDIARRITAGNLTSASWFRSARLIDTLTWETSEVLAVRIPDCDRCRRIHATTQRGVETC